MAFNIFGFNVNGPGDGENVQAGQGGWNSFGNRWQAKPEQGNNAFKWGQPVDTPWMEPAGNHPDDPPSMDAYPYGRPPLKPEQTMRAYARFFGLDPSTLDANNLQVPHPDEWQRPQGVESNAGVQHGGFSASAPDYHNSSRTGWGHGDPYEASSMWARNYDLRSGENPLGSGGWDVNWHASVSGNPVNGINPSEGMPFDSSSASVVPLADDGTPGDRARQKQQMDSICNKLGLDEDQRKQLHKAITGQNLGYLQILNEAIGMFGGK